MQQHSNKVRENKIKMQEIIADKGQAFGRISPLRTLATMEVKEIWRTTAETVRPNSLRAAASRLGRDTGRFFAVRMDSYENITVTRIL